MSYLILSLFSLFAWALTLPGWKKLGLKRLDYRFLTVSILYLLLYAGAFLWKGVNSWVGALIIAAPPFFSLFFIFRKAKNLHPLSYVVIAAHFFPLLPAVLLLFPAGWIGKAAIVLLYLGGIVWISFAGFPRYLHKKTFGTYTGKIREEAPDFTFYTADGESFTRDDLTGKWTVFYIWSEGCGDCFEQFPLVEKLHQEYESDPDIQVFAVYAPFAGPVPEHVKELIFGYGVPQLFMKNPGDAEALFGISLVPFAVVVSPEGKLVYRGRMVHLRNLRGVLVTHKLV